MPPRPTFTSAQLAAARAEQTRVLSGVKSPPPGVGAAYPVFFGRYAYRGSREAAAPAGYWSDPHSDLAIDASQLSDWQAGGDWVLDLPTGRWFAPEAYGHLRNRRAHWFSRTESVVPDEPEPLWNGLSWGDILGHPWRYSGEARAWAEATRLRFPYRGGVQGVGLGDTLPATIPYVPGGCPPGYIPGPNNSYCTWDWGARPMGPDGGVGTPSGGLPSAIPPTFQGNCPPNQVQGPLGCLDPSQIPGMVMSNDAPCGSGYVAVGPYCLPAAFLPPDNRPSTTLPGPGPSNACPNGGTDLFGVCLKPGDLPGLPAGLPPISTQGCPPGQVSIAGVCLPIAQPWPAGVPVPPDFTKIGGQIVPSILAQLPPGTIPPNVLPPGIMLPGALPATLPPNTPPPVLVCDQGCHPSANGKDCVCPDSKYQPPPNCPVGSSRHTAGGPCVSDGVVAPGDKTAAPPASGLGTVAVVGGVLALAAGAYFLLRSGPPAATSPHSPPPRH